MRAPYAPDRSRTAIILIVLAALLVVSTAGWAQSTAAPTTTPVSTQASASERTFAALDLERLVDKADWIVHASVGTKESRWAGGNIETSHQLTVQEWIKGSGPSSLEVTNLGGEAPGGLPMAQHIRGSAQLFQGEEVVLFLRTETSERLANLNDQRRAAGLQPMEYPAESHYATSPRIVGRAKGKFNVITLDDGRKLLTRFRPVGVIPDASTQELMIADVRARLQPASPRMSGMPEGMLGPGRTMRKASPSAVATLDPAGTTAAAEQVLPEKNYSPSRVTDPAAPALQAADPVRARRVIPHNMDGVAVPITFDTFKREIARIESKKQPQP